VFTSVIIILLGTAVLNLNEPFIRIRFNIVFCNVLIYLKSAEAALFVETLSGDTRPNFLFLLFSRVTKMHSRCFGIMGSHENFTFNLIVKLSVEFLSLRL
jgi:hypothetical protein